MWLDKVARMPGGRFSDDGRSIPIECVFIDILFFHFLKMFFNISAKLQMTAKHKIDKAFYPLLGVVRKVSGT